jgi:predicted glycosyltransferase
VPDFLEDLTALGEFAMTRMGAADQRCRVALYSHDTMGIGHMRRNLLIAQTLARSSARASVLLIAGACEASAFVMPPGVDCLTLPSLYKKRDGEYGTRHLRIELENLVALRSRAIEAALEAFEPDVLIVDKVPRGAQCELDPVLNRLRTRKHTHCVLGLREILDDPRTVRQEWDALANEDAIRTFYDAVWVYGDPLVYDLVREYRLGAEVAAKASFTGYFDQRQRLKVVAHRHCDPLAELGLSPGRLVLCMVGGGQDGGELAEAFMEAELPCDTNAVLMTGPFMPRATQVRLRRRAAERSCFRVLDFVTEPSLFLSRADAVISMGGYNTISEVLSFEKPLLVVPRVKPRQEQFIRAERLRDLGLADMLHPDQANSGNLTEWLAREHRSPPQARNRLDFGGLARLPHLLRALLSDREETSTRRKDEVLAGTHS